jgi:hypothetical protein
MGANKPNRRHRGNPACRHEVGFVGALAENLDFSRIKLGGLSEGGLLVQARGID